VPRTTKPRATVKKTRPPTKSAGSRRSRAETASTEGAGPSAEATGELEGRSDDDGADGEAVETDAPLDGEREGDDEEEGSKRADLGHDEHDESEADDQGGTSSDDEPPASRSAAGARSGSGRESDGEDGSGPIERFDALSAYLREVQRHPLLTPEETQKLAAAFVEKQDAATAARLVTANLRLVVKIAYEYRRAYRNIMDLIQEGNIGLMQAVKRYDPYRGVKLSSYAAWWIRAYILRFILNNWRLVKLGTTQAQRKLFFNLRKKRAELQALGIDPTNAEVAKQLNVPESEVAEMDVRLQSSEKSLDAPIGDGEGRATAKIDTMPSLVEGPEALMADSELAGLLKEKLASFRETLAGKDKELAIFDERLVSDEPLTLQELGDRFGISRERVRQLEQRLTGRLREYLRESMGDAVEVA
jgi:RNA polymerase sigma-32 factor